MNGYMFQESNKTYTKLSLKKLSYPFSNKNGIRAISTGIITESLWTNLLQGFDNDIDIHLSNNKFILDYNKSNNKYNSREIIDKNTGYPIKKTTLDPRTNLYNVKEYTIEPYSVKNSDISMPDLSNYTEYIKNEEQ